MLMRPISEIPQVPDKFPAWHIAGHALRAIAYGFGAYQLGHLGITDFTSNIGAHDFGSQALQGVKDAAMVASSLYLVGGTYYNTKRSLIETYYNTSEMGRRINQAIRDQHNPPQMV